MKTASGLFDNSFKQLYRYSCKSTCLTQRKVITILAVGEEERKLSGRHIHCETGAYIQVSRYVMYGQVVGWKTEKEIFKNSIFYSYIWTLKKILIDDDGPHYENTPMQYTAIFHGSKKDNF